MKTTTQCLLEEHALSFRRPVHWKISTGPPDRQFNAADQANHRVCRRGRPVAGGKSTDSAIDIKDGRHRRSRTDRARWAG
jgi:hypothetical protein